MAPSDPDRLSTFPWVLVRLDCRFCTRRGEYRLARLAARYGAEAELEAVLSDLARDCAWWNGHRKYEPKCGARFTDLHRQGPPPPPDHPPHAQPLRLVDGDKPEDVKPESTFRPEPTTPKPSRRRRQA